MLILASGRSESGLFMSSSKGATRVRKHQIMLSSTPADERNCKRYIPFSKATVPIINHILERGVERDGRVSSSVGSTGGIGPARGLGCLVEEEGCVIG